MREKTADIAQLCASWRDQLADAARGGQQQFAVRLLGLLGWDQPIPFSPRPAAEGMSSWPCLLRGDGQCIVAAHFLPPGVLDPPGAAVERGLDFCPATRALLEETSGPNVDYLLATDLHRSYLYDARTAELLLWSDDPRGFNTELAPALRRDQVVQGSLENLRREPRSAVARRLREWMHRWEAHLCRDGRVTEERAGLLFDRLCVARFLFDREILRRTRHRLRERYLELAARAEGPSPRHCGRDLVALFHDMWLDWRSGLFAPAPDLDAALAQDDTAAAWLRETTLLARNKFTIPTILECFNYGDPAEKMRVRMVPEENEDRDEYLARQTLETVDAARVAVDVAEEGYRAVTHWFDRLVAVYDRLDAEFDLRSRAAAPPAGEVDLFAWSERDARRPAACLDKTGYACGAGLSVRCGDARQRRVARLLLTLHLAAVLDARHEPANRLPAIDHLFGETPHASGPGRAAGKTGVPRVDR